MFVGGAWRPIGPSASTFPFPRRARTSCRQNYKRQTIADFSYLPTSLISPPFSGKIQSRTHQGKEPFMSMWLNLTYGHAWVQHLHLATDISSRHMFLHSIWPRGRHYSFVSVSLTSSLVSLRGEGGGGRGPSNQPVEVPRAALPAFLHSEVGGAFGLQPDKVRFETRRLQD